MAYFSLINTNCKLKLGPRVHLPHLGMKDWTKFLKKKKPNQTKKTGKGKKIQLQVHLWKNLLLFWGICGERESLACSAFIRCQQHDTSTKSCKNSDYKAQDGSLDTFGFGRKTSQVWTWKKNFEFAGCVDSHQVPGTGKKSSSAMHQSISSLSEPQWFDTLPQFGLKDTACSVNNWLIHLTLPGNVQMQDGFVRNSKSSQKFQLLSLQCTYRRHQFARMFSQNPMLPNMELQSLTICLNCNVPLGAGNKAVGTFHVTASSLQIRDAEAFKAKHNHATYL